MTAIYFLVWYIFGFVIAICRFIFIDKEDIDEKNLSYSLIYGLFGPVMLLVFLFVYFDKKNNGIFIKRESVINFFKKLKK